MMQKELKERKQCSYKPSSVPIPSENDTGACHLSSPRVTPGLKHSTLRNHGISGGNTRNHLLRQITNWFKDKMK